MVTKVSKVSTHKILGSVFSVIYGNKFHARAQTGISLELDMTFLIYILQFEFFFIFMAFWSFMNACRVLEWALYDSFIPLLIFPIFSRSYRDFADFLPWFSYSRSNCIVLYCIYRSCSTSSASYFHDCRQTAQLLWLSINSITYISSFEHTLSVIYDRLCHICLNCSGS